MSERKLRAGFLHGLRKIRVLDYSVSEVTVRSHLCCSAFQNSLAAAGRVDFRVKERLCKMICNARYDRSL